MMGRNFFAAALALGIFAASNADAQATSSASSGMQFGLSGGVAMPMGDLGDIASTGFAIGGHLGFNPASMPFGIRADVAFNRFSLDSDIADGNVRAIGAMLNAIIKVPTQSSVAPYLVAGPGIYNAKLDVDGCGDECDGETKVALQGGAGLQFNLSGLTPNLEVKYVTIFTDEERVSFLPITFGINFGGGSSMYRTGK